MKVHHIVMIVSFITSGHSANILGVFPAGGTSHWLPYEAILKALSAAGHNITAITSYPQKTPVPNWKDINVSLLKQGAINSLDMRLVETVLQKTTGNFHFITKLSQMYCEVLSNFSEVQDIISGKYKFDVVITEIFASDCIAGFAWKLNVPLISATSSVAQPWANQRIGNPVFPSYMPTIHLPYPTPMSFFTRLVNTAWHVYYTLAYDYYSNGEETDRISRKLFGADMPSIKDIVKNTSLIFTNSHHTLDGVTPAVHNLIEIGGIHVKDEGKEIPSHIRKFIDEAKHGVIYFTLGSLVLVSTLSNQTIKAFRDAFAEVPQRVLWKFELEMENPPPNVMIRKWFPQRDIFRHPNVKLFITHGGRMGILEAVHYGIPLVGIPLFFDQYRNIQNAVDKGIAVSLNFRHLTKTEILIAINTVLNDERYSLNMKKLSTLFKDRPLTPDQSVVYWTEYVIRHEGAYHMKMVAADMPLYQYLLLDVIAFCIVALFLPLYLLYYILRYSINLIRLRKVKTA